MNRCLATGVLSFYVQEEMFPLDLISCFFHVVNQLSLPPYGKIHPFPTDQFVMLPVITHPD